MSKRSDGVDAGSSILAPKKSHQDKINIDNGFLSLWGGAKLDVSIKFLTSGSSGNPQEEEAETM